MNKKLRRLMQPQVAPYFIVLALFCVAALLMKQYVLAAVETGVVLLFFGVVKWMTLRRKQAIAEYVRAADEILHHTGDGEVPFPVALVKLDDNELLWGNKAFVQLTELRESMSAKYISEVFPDFSVQWLASGKSESENELTYRKRRYRVCGTILPSKEGKHGIRLGMIYLLDQTELLQVRDEYIRSRPIVSIILVDNYDELTNNLTDAGVSNLNAELNNRINEWAEQFDGLLRKLERNRYLFLFEAKDLARMAEGKFSLLESMRAVTNPGGISATVSVGIGKDGVDFREDYDFAALSIEMALSRGGDQVVIKDRYDFTFFGGRAHQTERRTKVKARVMASSLSELIVQSSRVFIMGHKMADLDAVGAAAGVCCLCRKKGKKANIVIDPEMNAAGPLLKMLQEQPEYHDCFITGQINRLLDGRWFPYTFDHSIRPGQTACF